MKPAERKARFDALVRIGCVVCRRNGIYSEPHIHHALGIKYRATGKKASDEHTYPLCGYHHQGADGVHHLGLREFERRFGGQDEMLEEVNSLIERYNMKGKT